MATITFVVPVRHPINAPDWPALVSRLTQTLRSISSQTCDDWKAVVVANRGSSLPEMPDRIMVEWVDFEPNPIFDTRNVDREAAYEAVRLDKGKRILAGMMRFRYSRYFMVVDDDDFVSNKIAAFVRDHDGENGWKIGRGYLWSETQPILYTDDDFSNLCGTSLIIRSDLLGLPESSTAADIEFVKRSLGSHIFIADDLAASGRPLGVLPFRGAVYRVGHRGAHSKSLGILRSKVLRKNVLLSPRRLIRTISRFRFLDARAKREFFGGDKAGRSASAVCL